MRKIKTISLSVMLAAALSMPAYAETIPETPVSAENETDMESVSEETLTETLPSAGETENDGNGRSEYDPDEVNIPTEIEYTGDGSVDGYATYHEYIESRRQETLSYEQISMGYKIIDGIVYKPGELNGEAGEEMIGGVEPSAYTGYATITFRVPPGVHGDLAATFISTNNYKAYTQEFLEYNDYKGSITLPDGTYRVKNVRMYDDEDQQYSSDLSTFDVKAGASNTYTFDVLKNGEIVHEDDTEAAGNTEISGTNENIQDFGYESANSTDQKTLIDAEPAKKPVNIGFLILNIIAVAIPVTAWIYLVIKKKNDRRGFW